MTVFQDRHARWRFDFRLRGVRHTGPALEPDGSPATTKTAARAAEERARVAARAAAGQAAIGLTPGAYTLAQAIDAELEARPLRTDRAGRTDRHAENRRIYAREILGYFGAATPLHRIDDAAIAGYVAWALSQRIRIWTGSAQRRLGRANPKNWKEGPRTRSPATLNRYLTFLCATMARAHLTRDPLTGQSRLPFPPRIDKRPVLKRRPTPIDDAELAAIEAAAAPWLRDAVQLARAFGLRLEEALTRTRAHVSHGRRGLLLDAAETKGARDDFLAAGGAAWELLLRLDRQAAERGVEALVTWPGPGWAKREREGEAHVWRPLKNPRRAWKTAQRAAGLADGKRRRFHDVRASFVTAIASVPGASAAQVQAMARHADPKTTAAYIAFADEALRGLLTAAAPERIGDAPADGTGTDSQTGGPNRGRPPLKAVG